MIKTEQNLGFSVGGLNILGNITPGGPLSTVITQNMKKTHADG